MNFAKPAALLLLGALACSAAHASRTYTYDSNAILGYGGGPGVEFTFSFTVPDALADGSYDFAAPADLPAGFTYVATDGDLALTDPADLFGVSGPQFTVAGGEIVSYAFYAQDLLQPVSPVFGVATFYAAKLAGQSQDDVQVVDPSNPNIVGYDFTDPSGAHHMPQANRGPDDASGSWTLTSVVGSVPEPGSFLLMSLGSVLLLALSGPRLARRGG